MKEKKILIKYISIKHIDYPLPTLRTYNFNILLFLLIKYLIIIWALLDVERILSYRKLNITVKFSLLSLYIITINNSIPNKYSMNAFERPIKTICTLMAALNVY